MTTLEIAIENAKVIALNTRDFCGDERSAVIESLKEDGIKPTQDLLSRIASEVNASWSSSQAKAGVKRKYHTHGSSFQRL